MSEEIDTGFADRWHKAMIRQEVKAMSEEEQHERILADTITSLRAERDALKRDLLLAREAIKNQLEWGKQAESDRDYWKKQATASDGELVSLEDALIGRDELCDAKGKLVDRSTVLKERIRDLIAAEGEAGDLRAERDALRARVEMSLCQLEQTTVQWLADKVERDALRARVERLEEALRFYADLVNWESFIGGRCPAENDLGARARAALEGKP